MAQAFLRLRIERTVRRKHAKLRNDFLAKQDKAIQAKIDALYKEIQGKMNSSTQNLAEEPDTSNTNELLDDNDIFDQDKNQELEDYILRGSRKKLVTLSDKKRIEFVHDCILMQSGLKLPKGASEEL